MDTILLGVRRLARPVTRRGLVALPARWLERARSRRQLRLLLTNPHALADLGLTRDEADLESIKPFWR
jgi:uncharacterized protein YjiS (DUF1127 family)